MNFRELDNDMDLAALCHADAVHDEILRALNFGDPFIFKEPKEQLLKALASISE